MIRSLHAIRRAFQLSRICLCIRNEFLQAVPFRILLDHDDSRFCQVVADRDDGLVREGRAFHLCERGGGRQADEAYNAIKNIAADGGKILFVGTKKQAQDSVTSDEGEQLGVIDDVLQTGANDVYVVKKAGANDLLIPAIKDCILDVDVENGTMKVHLLAGLR